MLCGPKNLRKKPKEWVGQYSQQESPWAPSSRPWDADPLPEWPDLCQLSRFQHCETLIALLPVLALHPPQYTEMNYQHVLSHAQPTGPNHFPMESSPSLPAVP